MVKILYAFLALASLQGCAASQQTTEPTGEQVAPLVPRSSFVVLPSGDTIITTPSEALPAAPARPKSFLGRVLAGKTKQKNVGNTTYNITVTDRSKTKVRDEEKTKVVQKPKEKTVSKPVTKIKERTDSHDKDKSKLKDKPTTNSGLLATPGSQVAAVAVGVALVLLFIFFKSKKSA
jgi:hypothetical protein